ncbi:hypothetical protein GJ496_005373 [Pomphorhynchus laevis]|nr:hypothetical protein GJ496_005373 [Pomphorhynchus laevis]
MDLSVEYNIDQSLNDPRRSVKLNENHSTLFDIRPQNTHEESIVKPYPMTKSICSMPRISENMVNIDHTKLISHVINNQASPWVNPIRDSKITSANTEVSLLEKEPALQQQLRSTVKLAELMVQTSAVVDLSEADGEYTTADSNLTVPLSGAVIETFRFAKISSLSTVACDWSPERSSIFATAVCPVPINPHECQFITNSYIWNLDYPSQPYEILYPMFYLTTIEFNKQNHYQLIGGMTNGQTSIFDIRSKANAVSRTSDQHKHTSPVNSACWVQSRTNQEFLSSSAESAIMWWDSRMTGQPIETFEVSNDVNTPAIITCLDYEFGVPNRFTVGLLNGSITVCNRKAKSDTDKIIQSWDNCHISGVRTLQRNPSQNKCILSCGDSSVKIWHDDFKESHIRSIRCQNDVLLAKWSPTNPTSFITINAFNKFHIWDLAISRNTPVSSVNVGTRNIYCMSINVKNGQMIAVGKGSGTVSVVQLREDFARSSNKSSQSLSSILDKELLYLRKKDVFDYAITNVNAHDYSNAAQTIKSDTSKFQSKMQVQIECLKQQPQITKKDITLSSPDTKDSGKEVIPIESTDASSVHDDDDTSKDTLSEKEETIMDDSRENEIIIKCKRRLKQAHRDLAYVTTFKDSVQNDYLTKRADLDKTKFRIQRRAKYMSRMDIMRRLTAKDQIYMTTLDTINKETREAVEKIVIDIQDQIDELSTISNEEDHENMISSSDDQQVDTMSSTNSLVPTNYKTED